MFAVVGTMVSAVIMAAVIFGLTRLNIELAQYGMLDFLIFGAIMSATDPVATLAIFGRQNADPTLFSLVFGESVLNDAVAITFFKCAFAVSSFLCPCSCPTHFFRRTLVGFKESLATHGEFTAGAFFEAVGSFLLLGLGSTLLGFVLGAINALILRRTLIKHHPPMEILFVMSFAYATYVLSDGVGLSGIVAIFFFGITTRHYTYYNLSETSKAGSMWLFTYGIFARTFYIGLMPASCRAFKELAETTVFCFLGLSILQEQKAYNVALIAIATVRDTEEIPAFATAYQILHFQFACLLSRALMISPLSLLLNLKRKGNTKITMKMQAVMWNAGLRGAVAYALSLRLPDSPGRSLFVTTIHAVVIFTILVHGGLTGPLLGWTGLSAGKEENGGYSHVAADTVPLNVPKKKKIHGFWSSIDKNYLIPFLSYPRNVYKQEQEEKEKGLESELQDTSLLEDPSLSMENGSTNGLNAADETHEEVEIADEVPPARAEDQEVF